MKTVPVLTVGSVDAVLRDTLAGNLLVDVPDAVTVRYDFLLDAGMLRRIVAGSSGLLEDVLVSLPPGCCVSCALRDDVMATVSQVVERARPAALAVALPATVDPVPVAYTLQTGSGASARLAAVLAVFDGGTLEADLLGDELLVERGLAPEADRRSVGEALARQIETADLLCAAGELTGRGSALLDHLVGAAPVRLRIHDGSLARLLDRGPAPGAFPRADLRTAAPTGAGCRHGVWTMDLRSPRPFHPRRLLEQVERLGDGPVRGRGYFWLPSRPGTRCAWDGAGGQLSIGALGRWDRRPETRLVITGTEREPSDLAAAFEAALATDEELADGRVWGGLDGFDDWLGPPDRASAGF